MENNTKSGGFQPDEESSPDQARKMRELFRHIIETGYCGGQSMNMGGNGFSNQSPLERQRSGGDNKRIGDSYYPDSDEGHWEMMRDSGDLR